MISAIIQARMSSTRLPGKSMLNLMGYPLIHHVVKRISICDSIEKIVLATSDSSADDIIEAWADSAGIFCYRGSENDVLDRYYRAAIESKSELIIRVTADDPFKDPMVIDCVVNHLNKCHLDFAYNNKPPSFPEGLDVEVFTFSALEDAAHKAEKSSDREHVTQYLYRHPEFYRQENITCNKQLSHLRWTIDTSVDFLMVKKVYQELYEDGCVFLMEDILELIKRHPEIALINSNEKRSAMYL